LQDGVDVLLEESARLTRGRAVVARGVDDVVIARADAADATDQQDCEAGEKE
jgi:hypothetical protein